MYKGLAYVTNLVTTQNGGSSSTSSQCELKLHTSAEFLYSGYQNSKSCGSIYMWMVPPESKRSTTQRLVRKSFLGAAHGYRYTNGVEGCAGKGVYVSPNTGT